jgi:alkylated DNA repair protein alkB family protein 1
MLVKKEMAPENKFRQKFKYYKQRVPEPCLDAVIDPHKTDHAKYFTLCSTLDMSAQPENKSCLKVNSPVEWRCLSSRLSPGFVIITGALSPEHQLYWARRCLKDYSAPPSRRNIDTVSPEVDGDWFAEAAHGGSGVTDKLRWATMGYHHNWDTKVGIGFFEQHMNSYPT